MFFSLAFQGGAEHNVPVVISKIFKDQVGKKMFLSTAAVQDLEMFVGAAVNKIKVSGHVSEVGTLNIPLVTLQFASTLYILL